MTPNNNPPASGDHLAAMLARGDAPTLDVLLTLCPDEPLADVDEIDREGMTARRHAEWWNWAADLRVQYPGFQDAYWYLEHMKYGDRSPRSVAGPSASLRWRALARICPPADQPCEGIVVSRRFGQVDPIAVLRLAEAAYQRGNLDTAALA